MTRNSANNAAALDAKKSLNTSSFLPSLPSSLLSQPSQLSLDTLLEELTHIARDQKNLEVRRQEILDALDQLVEDGQADDKLSWNDYTITRRNRTSYVYPDHINDQRIALKEAERLSVALGEATVKKTTFWEVRQPKP